MYNLYLHYIIYLVHTVYLDVQVDTLNRSPCLGYSADTLQMDSIQIRCNTRLLGILQMHYYYIY